MRPMTPLGMSGIQNRINQIRDRMDQVFGSREDDSRENPPEFKPVGTDSSPKGASTPIGGYIGGFTPFNPLGAGVRISPEVNGKADFSSLIEKAALAAGVDPDLFSSLVNQESAFDPNAVSNKGARGLAQLMPDTARQLGVTDINDPEQNLNAGAKYLAQMMKQFGGDPSLALAAYNAGPGRVQRSNGIPPIAETQNYVKRIMAAYGAKKGQ